MDFTIFSFLAQPEVGAAYVIGDTLALEHWGSFSPIFRIGVIVLKTYGKGCLTSIFCISIEFPTKFFHIFSVGGSKHEGYGRFSLKWG